jgi:hypothetical protein
MGPFSDLRVEDFLPLRSGIEGDVDEMGRIDIVVP